MVAQKMIPQEFIAGAILMAAGSVFLLLQQQDWYRNMFFSGNWRLYNTPSGRAMANIQCVVVILMGLACFLGFIPFEQ